MRIRFNGGEEARGRLNDAIMNELQALPQAGEIEIGESRTTVDTLRDMLRVEADCCLYIDDEMPGEVFGYIMFVLSLSGFSIEEAQIIEPRPMPAFPVEDMLFDEDGLLFDEDDWDIF